MHAYKIFGVNSVQMILLSLPILQGNILFFLNLNNNVLRGNMGSFFSMDIGTRLYRDLLLFQFCEVCFTKFIVIGKSGLQILTKLRLTSFSDPPKTPEDVWCSEQYFFS